MSQNYSVEVNETSAGIMEGLTEMAYSNSSEYGGFVNSTTTAIDHEHKEDENGSTALNTWETAVYYTLLILFGYIAVCLCIFLVVRLVELWYEFRSPRPAEPDVLPLQVVNAVPDSPAVAPRVTPPQPPRELPLPDLLEMVSNV